MWSWLCFVVLATTGAQISLPAKTPADEGVTLVIELNGKDEGITVPHGHDAFTFASDFCERHAIDDSTCPMDVAASLVLRGGSLSPPVVKELTQSSTGRNSLLSISRKIYQGGVASI
ncbi:unnamed protein product, partial [Discosporangium mesarthrocarpum]